jgi:hypothetical protein
MSNTGMGAKILYPPDAPLNIADNTDITNDMQVGLTWSNGASDGDTLVIDYQVQYKLNDIWTTIATGIQPKYYTTTVALVKGDSYWFRVIARNSVGTSLESDKEHVPVLILVAQKSAQPLAPVTLRDDNKIIITWKEPVNYGSTPIMSYTVQIRNTDEITFNQTSECNGVLPLVRDAHSCTVLISTLVSPPFSLAWGQHVYA